MDAEQRKQVKRLLATEEPELVIVDELQDLNERLDDVSKVVGNFDFSKVDFIQGDEGPQGEQGVRGPQGPQGPEGERGKDGINGATPVKGIDYFTDDDVNDISLEIQASLPDFQTIFTEKIDEGLNLTDLQDTPSKHKEGNLLISKNGKYEHLPLSRLPVHIQGGSKGPGGTSEILEEGSKVLSSHRFNFGPGFDITAVDGTANIDVDLSEITGQVGTLQQVTDNGATTTNDITVAGLEISDTSPTLTITHTTSGDNADIVYTDSLGLKFTTSTGGMTFAPDSGIVNVGTAIDLNGTSGDIMMASASDSTGVRVDVTNQILKDSSDFNSLNWDNRQGIWTDGTTITLDWAIGILYDSTGTSSVDWITNRHLIDSLGSVVVDWDGQYLNDNTSFLSVDWGQRKLFDTDGTTEVYNWNTGTFSQNQTIESTGNAQLTISSDTDNNSATSEARLSFALDGSSIADVWYSESEAKLILEANGNPGIKISEADGAVELSTGTSILEFSTDGTLAGNSDDAVPTEKAVKTYVDASGEADASTTVKGIVELATAAETTTGTDTTRAVTPDGLAGSEFGERNVGAICVDFTTDTAVGNGVNYFHIPDNMNGMDLVAVHAEVITAGTTGTTDIQIHNLTQAVDMLTTKITIDSTETGSDTAATPAVIDTANDDVATNDVIRIDVDAISTTAAKGLIVTLTFKLP